MVFSRARARGVACALAVGVILFPLCGGSASAAEARKALLILPVASGTPGQEWSAKALGGLLEDGFSALRSVRLLAGTAREVALRELSAGATVTPEAFLDTCRRAGADLVVLGGSTLTEGRLALEIKTFDVGAARELPAFRGDEPQARAFNLVEAAVRHVAVAAGLGSAESLFPRGVTVSLEAYAAYRAALLEEAPAARVEKLRGVLKLDAKYADPVRRLGVELFRQGSLDEALGVLERAVALDPKVAEARNNYGVALAAAGRPEPAQREFEEAVALSPDYAEARLNLARVFEDRGRPTDAEKQYLAVLEADAGNDKARSGLAALYDSTGRPELAIKEFRQLSARRPDLAEAEFIRAGQEARKAREYARAEKHFQRATDINPQFAQAWAERGTNSYLAGEYPKSVEYFRKALAIDPGQASYHYYLGLALDKGRQQDEALREYRRAVELGGPPEARLGLARAALDSGDPGLAVEELNRLLVASPDHAEAKVLLAQATSEMEARRRLVEGQSQFANQRLARLEQIVADTNRANRELEARLQSVTQEKRLLEKQAQPELGAGPGGLVNPPPAAAAAAAPIPVAAKEPPPAAAAPTAPIPAAAKEPPTAGGGPTADKTVPDAAPAGDLGRDVERLRGELAVERDARRREGAEAQAVIALLRVEKNRLEREFAAERERFKADATATEATRREIAAKTNEVAELKGQLLAAQGAISKAEDAQKAERERSERALAAEREDRRAETDKLQIELAPGYFKKQEKDRLLQELAAEKSRVAAAQAAREKAERALAAEHEARSVDVEKLKTELAAALVRKQDRDRLTKELAEEAARARAEQAGRQKAEQSLADERERGAKALAVERAGRQSEVDKLKAELAAALGRVQDQDRLAQELAAERTRLLGEQAGRQKAEQSLVDERAQAAQVLVAERAGRQSEVDKLKAELAAAIGRAQDRDRLAQELAAERTRALAEQAAREKAEQAIAAERLRGEQAVVAEREGSRHQSAQIAARVGELETQVKTLAQTLQSRDAELAAERAREGSLVTQLAKGQADLELLAERQSALEARSVAESRTLAERERALEKTRLAVRDLALELGRIALRSQSWEKAQAYLEQAAEADPRDGEVWYGLGEALFQLGQYEKSRQMYDKAKQIY